MDKFEYELKVEQIEKLIVREDYSTAKKIADTMEWKREKDTKLLRHVAELYAQAGDVQKALHIYNQAYNASARGILILERMIELAVNFGQLDLADEICEEYHSIGGFDADYYLMKFQISESRGDSQEQRIVFLEKYCNKELDEEALYRLAWLYDRVGREDDCVRICDYIIDFFCCGEMVERAVTLKKNHAPLTKYQERRVSDAARYEDNYKRFLKAQEEGEKRERREQQQEQQIREDALMEKQESALGKQITEIVEQNEKEKQEIHLEELVADEELISEMEFSTAASQVMEEQPEQIQSADKEPMLEQPEEIPWFLKRAAEAVEKIRKATEEKKAEEEKILEEAFPEETMTAEEEPAEEGTSEAETISEEEAEEPEEVSEEEPEEPKEVLEEEPEEPEEASEEETKEPEEASEEETKEPEEASEEEPEEPEEASEEELEEPEEASEEETEESKEISEEEKVEKQPDSDEFVYDEEGNIEYAEEEASEIGQTEETKTDENVSSPTVFLYDEEACIDDEADEETIEEIDIEDDDKKLCETESEDKTNATEIDKVETAEITTEAEATEEVKENAPAETDVQTDVDEIEPTLKVYTHRKLEKGTSELAALDLVVPEGSFKVACSDMELGVKYAVELVRMIPEEIRYDHVGRVSSRQVNKVKFTRIEQQLDNDILLITDAGQLSNGSLESIYVWLKKSLDNRVILVDNQQQLESLEKRKPKLMKRFQETYFYEHKATEEWLELVDSYVDENDCVLDDNAFQLFEDYLRDKEEKGGVVLGITLKEAVQDAMHQATKFSLSNLLSAILNTKYDDDGFLILSDRHFR